MTDIESRDQNILDLLDRLDKAADMRRINEREIGRLVVRELELERELRLPCVHCRALEAEVAKLQKTVADYEGDYRCTLEEICEGDNSSKQHCACVPNLRKRVRELEAEVERLKAEKYTPSKIARMDLAAKVHEVWAKWMHWQAKWVKLIPLELSDDKGFEAIDRWERQAQTPYEELTEKEQASDLEIADAYIAIVSRGEDHTWEQERAAVCRWLWAHSSGIIAMPIERGEHWTKG